jgi:hypothetical protein
LRNLSLGLDFNRGSKWASGYKCQKWPFALFSAYFDFIFCFFLVQWVSLCVG